MKNKIVGKRDQGKDKCGMWYNVSVKHFISTGQTELMDKYEIIDYLIYLKNKRLEK
jgi:hypothetical protein